MKHHEQITVWQIDKIRITGLPVARVLQALRILQVNFVRPCQALIPTHPDRKTVVFGVLFLLRMIAIAEYERAIPHHEQCG